MLFLSPCFYSLLFIPCLSIFIPGFLILCFLFHVFFFILSFLFHFFYSVLFIPGLVGFLLLFCAFLFRANGGMQGRGGIKSNFRITPSLPHPLPDGMIPKMTERPVWIPCRNHPLHLLPFPFIHVQLVSPRSFSMDLLEKSVPS